MEQPETTTAATPENPNQITGIGNLAAPSAEMVAAQEKSMRAYARVEILRTLIGNNGIEKVIEVADKLVETAKKFESYVQGIEDTLKSTDPTLTEPVPPAVVS